MVSLEFTRENNQNMEFNEGILPNLWQILDSSEETKSKICDLKFLCSNGEFFHSFRLIFASISSFLKDILGEEFMDVITLPEDKTYEEIKAFHQCLLSNLNEEELKANFDFFHLFQIKLNQKETEGKEVLICAECDKEYVSEANYRKHMKIHQKEFEKLESNQVSKLKNKRKVQKPKRFEDEENSVAFYYEEEINAEVYRKRRKKGFKCDNCEKYFSSKQSLDNHQKIHSNERPFSCEKCGKSFTNLASLQTHKKLHEEQKNLIKCPHCDKSLNNASNLQRHIRSVHFELSDKKLHECQECGKVFKDPSAFKAHAKIHTGLRPFNCDTCGKKFLTAAQLRVHSRIHTGERPYACDKCEKKFVTKDNLKSHQMHKHVGVTYTRNQLCSICGLSFIKPFDLKVHLLKHSGKLYSCLFTLLENLKLCPKN